MKKVLYILVASASMALASCSTSKLPQKELGLQLYSIRHLIGDANKFAANGDAILKIQV